MEVTSVKELQHKESLGITHGYLVNNTNHLPLSLEDNRVTISNEELTIAVDAWIALGNTPEIAYTFEELQSIKMEKLNEDLSVRHMVQVPLEDTSVLTIWGSREDQFDIGDRYELMQEDSVPNIYIRDAYGIIEFLGHLDVKRCYKAITIHRQDVIEYQWVKEAEIMACTTQTELDAITWTIP